MNPTQTDIVNPTLSLDPATGLTETLRTTINWAMERARQGAWNKERVIAYLGLIG